MKGWKKNGNPVESVDKIPMLPVKDLISTVVRKMLDEDKSIVILDLRDKNPTKDLAITGYNVLNIRTVDLLEKLSAIPKDKPIILCDKLGLQVQQVAPFLKGKGFNVLGYVHDGIMGWARDK